MAHNLIKSSWPQYPSVTRLLIILIGTVGFKIPRVFCNAPDSITYTCNTTGVHKITNFPDGHSRLLNEDKTIWCTLQPDNTIKCPQESLSLLKVYVFYEETQETNIIGGASMKMYTLQCSDKYVATGVSKQFSAGLDQTNPNAQSVSIQHSIEMEIKKKDDKITRINLGDELTLDLKGTVEGTLFISPIKCTATDTNAQNSVDIWWTEQQNGNKLGCMNKETITHEKWTRKGANAIQLTFNAFRFVTSETVTVTCSANVCSKTSETDCTQKCVENASTTGTEGHSVGRRRRSNTIETENSVVRQATASFHVVLSTQVENSTPGMFVHSYTFYLSVVFTALIMKRFG